MRRPRTPLAAALAALALLAASPPAPDDPGAAIDRAKALLDRDDARAAAVALEAALPAAGPARRAEVLSLLRRAYPRAAELAQQAGKPREAEHYRDNLAILARTPTPAPAPRPPERLAAFEPDPPPAGEPIPRAERPAAPISPAPAPVAIPAPAPTAPESDSDDPIDLIPPDEPATATAPGPAAPTPGPAAPPAGEGTTVAAADAEFRAERYDEARTLYAALAQAGRLPESRRGHWAYCRCVEVVRRINAQPQAADWPVIRAEIQAIRDLSPENWFAEYLRDLADDRSGQASAPAAARPAAGPVAQARRAQPRALIVRANNADEPPLPVAPTPAPAVGNWQVLNTPSFRVLHADPALADRVARAAEAARIEQAARWAGRGPAAPWSPKCDIYVYPNVQVYCQQTGQPPDSPGFSTMGLSAGRVVARRVNLRADAAELVEAVVPHEVTHVVLADLFPDRQIPRWADEGLAVLAEPPGLHARRTAPLDSALAADAPVFKVGTLMGTDYPDGRHWDLFYAQSVSLTGYLLELGPPARLVEFLRGSQLRGYDAELARLYSISGVDELHSRWLAHARSRPASAAIAGNPPAAPRR